MSITKILKYIFHSHKWKLVSNDTYYIMEREKGVQMIAGEKVGNVSVVRFKCSVCPAKLEVKYNEELKENI